MISFNSTYPFHLEGGVTVTVRRLSVIERAKRDLPIAGAQQRYDELLMEYRALPENPEDDTAEQRKERARLNSEIAAVLWLEIKPVVIRAGVEKIEGIETDGRPITVEEFLQRGDEAMLDAVYVVCDLAARLDADKLKNLQSLGTSNAPAASSSENMTAEPAETPSTTSSETAGSISPAM